MSERRKTRRDLRKPESLKELVAVSKEPPKHKEFRRWRAHPPVEVPRVRITVDLELAEIIRRMREDDMSNRAIRRYARAFLGLPEPPWPVRYKKRYQKP